MYQIGLLLLTGPFRIMVESISQYLKYANKNIFKRLYIKLEPEFKKPITKSEVTHLKYLSNFVPHIYNAASSFCQNVDVRVLLCNSKEFKSECDYDSKFEVVLTNSKEEDNNIKSYIDIQFKDKCNSIIKLDNESLKQLNVLNYNLLTSEFNVYNTVCLGGTFDRLHNGHKVLLSEAALRATKKLIVGITDGTMLKRKVLWELIEPIHKRIEDVRNFLQDVDPSLYYEVVPIIDPYGPTITNPDIDCIVVSEETKIGGEKVNSERKNRGMKELSMYVVDLVENVDKIPGEEEKLSSSTARIHLLGTCLKNPQVTSNDLYTIFLQGQPMTGKSDISYHLEQHGAIVINCSNVIKSILHHKRTLFSHKLKNVLPEENGFIDYGKVVLYCLKDKEIMHWAAENLCTDVTAEIKQKIQSYQTEGAKLIVIQDSVLLGGNLKCNNINEIWSTVMPITEIVKRLSKFYELSEEEATNIAVSLPNNEFFIKKSNRIFCNLWSTEITEQQISRAWSEIRQKI